MLDPRQDAAGDFRNHRSQPRHVGVEELFEVLGSRRDPVTLKHFAQNRWVGPAREVQIFGAVGQVESNARDFGEGFFPGPAALYERAVDIEKNESNHEK